MGKVNYEAIRERFAVKECEVYVPQWDGMTTLRRVPLDERMEAIKGLSVPEDEAENEQPLHSLAAENLRSMVTIVSKTIVDGDVRPFDTDAGRSELVDNHPMAVMHLIPYVMQINGLGKHADEVIDEAKNDLAATTNGS